MPGQRKRKRSTSRPARPIAGKPAPAVSASAAKMFGPALLGAIIALLVYLPAAWNEFTNWDDIAYIHNNPHMTAPDGLSRIWTTNESPQYYPLTFTAFRLQYETWGLNPIGYHLVNIVTHAINTVLVVYLMTALGVARWQSFAVALLFALSPVQVMSVAWVAELKNVLSTFFGLITLILLCRYFAGPSKARYLAAIGAFILALLCKSAWVALPIVAAVAGAWVFKKPWRRCIIAIIPMLGIAALSAAVTFSMEQQYQGEPLPGLGERMLIAPGALLFYFYKALIPIGLSPFYPRWEVSVTDVRSWIPAVVVVAMIALLSWQRRRLNGVAAWGIAAFILFLAPVLGVVPFGNMDVTWVSDHFMYYAVIGIYAALVVATSRLLVKVAPRGASSASATLLTLAAIVAAILAIRQIPVWKNAESMWARAAEFNPDSYVPHAGLAMAHVGNHDFGQAAGEFRRAIEMRPNDADTRTRYAGTLLQLNQIDEAQIQLERALANDPTWIPALLYLGMIAENRDDQTEAAARYREVLQNQSDQKDAAIRLAAILAATRDDALRDPPTAVQLAERLNLSMPRPTVEALDVLGMAYAANGQFDRAIQVTEQAAGMAQTAGNETQLSALRRRIELYRAGTPYMR